MSENETQAQRSLKKILVNRELQLSLILYSLIFAGLMGAVAFSTGFLASQGQLAGDTNDSLLLSVLLMAFFLAAGVAFGLYLTHRVAGPMYHLKQHMELVIRDETTAPIAFRQGDFFNEVATSYNAIIARLPKQNSTQNSTNK